MRLIYIQERINRTINRQMPFARQPWVYSSRDPTKRFSRSQFITQHFSVFIVYIFIHAQKQVRVPAQFRSHYSIANGFTHIRLMFRHSIDSRTHSGRWAENKLKAIPSDLDASSFSTCNAISFGVIDCSLHHMYESKTCDPIWPQPL